MKVESESEVTQSCPTLSDPMDCSLPGSSVYGSFQARVLEWGAIAFSGIYVYIHENIIHTKEYYLVIKKNNIFSCAATWMDLEIVILSKVSQTEKEKYHMALFI